MNGTPTLVNTQPDRTHIILHMDVVSSVGPIGLSVKRLGVFCVSTGWVNGIPGLVNAQRDRTHNPSHGRGVKRRSNLTFRKELVGLVDIQLDIQSSI